MFGVIFLLLSLVCVAAKRVTRFSRLVHPTAQDSANGAKGYQKNCATAGHGAKLAGGMGPALDRQAILAELRREEAPSTLWSDVQYTTMPPCRAPGSVCSQDIRLISWHFFCREKRRVPAGNIPLNDTVDLSKALPAK